MTTLDDVLWATAFQIASMLGLRVVILLPEQGGGIEVKAGYPPEDMLDAGRSRGRQMGLTRTTIRPGAAPIRCPVRDACSCRCAPGVAQSASSASTGIDPGRC